MPGKIMPDTQGFEVLRTNPLLNTTTRKRPCSIEMGESNWATCKGTHEDEPRTHAHAHRNTPRDPRSCPALPPAAPSKIGKNNHPRARAGWSAAGGARPGAVRTAGRRQSLAGNERAVLTCPAAGMRRRGVAERLSMHHRLAGSRQQSERKAVWLLVPIIIGNHSPSRARAGPHHGNQKLEKRPVLLMFTPAG